MRIWPRTIRDSREQWNFATLDMPAAWDINPGGSAGLIVAVVDSGVTTVSASLAVSTWNGTSIQPFTMRVAVSPDIASSRLVRPADFVGGTGPSPNVVDTAGHGTHVASTIGENTNNNLSEAGLAYRVMIMPVKVCASYWDMQFAMSRAGIPGRPNFSTSWGACTYNIADLTRGIRYAVDNGASVINLSLGGLQPSALLQETLADAVGRGAFVAIAGGNDFLNGNPPSYPAAYAERMDGVMAVGAVGQSLVRTSYSTTASYVEVAAPGGDGLDGGAAGQIWQVTMARPDFDPLQVVFPNFDRYAEVPFQGTSMATPQVAGTAALIMSQGVTDPAVVEALIKKTARHLGTAGKNNEYGYGLVQPRAALFGFSLAR